MKFKKIMAAIMVAALAVTAVGCGSSANNAASSGGSASASTESSASAENANLTPITADNPWEATEIGDGSWDRVQKAGKITVGLDDAFPPMASHDPQTNELVGFDIDMAAAISEKLGVEFEFQPSAWDSIVPSMLSSKFDVIISGMNMWDSRVAQVNYVPYGVAYQLLLVAPDKATDEMSNVEYFKDKVIGTQAGSTAEKYLTELGFEEGKNLKTYKTFPEATVDMGSGRLDALAIDSFGAAELLKSGDYKQVAQITSQNNENGAAADMIGIAVRKEDGDLQMRLAQAVDELIVSGQLAELSQKWIGEDITEPLKADAQARLDSGKYDVLK
jgi:polar amino acid transport system substrate-binding protein